MRRVALLLCLFISFSAIAKRYIVVGVSGRKTKRGGGGASSGAHQNLPKHHYKIEELYKIVHYAKKHELQEIIDNFDCQNGDQGNEDLGLLIMANSWGSKNGARLAKLYAKQCGKPVDLFIMVDGVKKPIGKFKKVLPAKKCVNYYQTKDFAKGGPIKNCDNHNLTHLCPKDSKAFECHILAEWNGSYRGKKEMMKYMNRH